MYSPVGVNTTLHCTVDNTHLSWKIDQMRFNGEVEAAILELRGIYKLGTTTSNGMTTSSVLVAGKIAKNNATMACCDSIFNKATQKSCTTIVIYGK